MVRDVLAFSFAALFLACSAPPEEACRAIAGALEDRLLSCGIAYSSLRTNPDVLRSCAQIAERVDRQTVRYEAAAASTCRDEIDAAPCDEGLLNRLSECAKRAFPGTKDAGASCEIGPECASWRCAVSASSCPGSCLVSPAPTGGPCAGNDDCQGGLYCARSGSTGTCTALPLAGQRCAMGLLSGSCAVGNFCESGTCQPRRGDGGGCVFGTECLATHRCVGGQVFPMRIGACTPWRRLEQSCQGDDECVPGLFCEGGACRVIARKVGELCGRTAGHTRAIGCASGYCDPTTNVCTEEVPPGGKCDDRHPCKAGSECVMGTCTANACT